MLPIAAQSLQQMTVTDRVVSSGEEERRARARLNLFEQARFFLARTFFLGTLNFLSTHILS